VTVIGTLTDEVTLRFTASGVAVASFTIASNDRRFDQASKSWKDGDATFLRCTLWREAAENAAQSLPKGTRVVATGALKQRNFEDREGNKRSVLELDVDELGASVQWATLKVARPDRSGGGSGGAKAETADDPWGQAPPATPAGGFADEPPF
jgi:single-strand DNA-binding protein